MQFGKVHSGIVLITSVLLSLMVFMSIFSVVFAAPGINAQLPFYGTLKNVSGTELSGTYDMVFRLYDAPTGGTLLDTSTHTTANGNPVTVSSGEFEVLLGSGTGNALDGVDFNDDTIYVGLTVGADSEMTPRTRLGAAAYAFNADTLDGYQFFDFIQNGSTATGTLAALYFASSTPGDTTYALYNEGGTLYFDGLAVGGGGSSLFTDSGAVTYLTSLSDNFAIGTSTASSARLTVQSTGTTDILNLFETGGTEVFTVLENGNVGIGTSTPGSTLTVVGDINIASPGAGILIEGVRIFNSSSTNESVTIGGNAGAGLLSDGIQNVAIGYNALNTATSSDGSTAVGYRAGFENQQQLFTGVGLNAGGQNTGASFTGIGVAAGASNSGDFLTALGSGAGQSNSGNNSVFAGYLAGFNNEGADAVGVGRESLAGNTAGQVVAVGGGALQYINAEDSIALGYRAGYGNSSERRDVSGSTFLGYQSGFAISTSSNNTFLGYQSGNSVTTGSNNLLLGYDVDTLSATQSNFLNISNSIYGDVATGTIGIGTSTALAARLTIQSEGTSDILNLFETAGTEVFTVLESGNVGIGSSTPDTKLYIADNTGNVLDMLTLDQRSAGDDRGAAIAFVSAEGQATSRIYSTRGESGASSDLHFEIENSNTATEFLRIDGSDLGMGIGTTTNLDRARLSIQSQGTTNILSLFETGGAEVLSVLENGLIQIGQASSSNVATQGLAVANGDITITVGTPDVTPVAVWEEAASLFFTNGFLVVDDYLYMTDFIGNQLVVVDISNITNPETISFKSTPGLSRPRQPFAANGYLYVGSGLTGAMAIFDYSDPNNLERVGLWTGGDDTGDVSVYGNYAYVPQGATADYISIVDVSDPTLPVTKGIWDPASTTIYAGGGKPVVRGNYMYADSRNADGFVVVDISNPTDPQLVGSYFPDDIAVLDSPNDIVIDGNVAYIPGGSSDNLLLLDISDPTNPTLLGNFDPDDTDILDAPRNVTVVGEYAYINGFTSDNVVIVNVSSSTNPTLAGVLDPNDPTVIDGPVGIQAVGNYLFVGNEQQEGFAIFDLGGVTTPTAEIGVLAAQDGYFDRLRVNQLLQADEGLSVGGDSLLQGSFAVFDTASTSAGEISQSLLFDAQNGLTLETLNADILRIGTSTASSARLTVQSTGTDDIFKLFETAGTEVFTVQESGNVGIGTSTPDQVLDVIGTIQASNLLGGATTLSTDANGNIIPTASDRNLKENVRDITDGLDIVLNLRGVRYDWIDEERFGSQTEVGFIAQEVDLILPEVVRQGGEYWSLNTPNILAVVVDAIQEIWQVVTGNQNKIAELEARLEALESGQSATVTRTSNSNSDTSSNEGSTDTQSSSDTDSVTDVEVPDNSSTSTDPVAEDSATSTPPTEPESPSTTEPVVEDSGPESGEVVTESAEEPLPSEVEPLESAEPEPEPEPEPEVSSQSTDQPSI